MFSPVTAYQPDRLRQFVAPVIPLVILAATGGVCLALYVNDLGVIHGLPYCVLAAVGGSFFWLRRRQFITGQAAAFIPPLILMFAMPPTRANLYFAIHLMSINLFASTAIYLLTTRTNKRTYALSAALELRASFDGPTGVLNRSAWIDMANRRLAEEQHLGRPVSCLFIDMDRFKAVNDHLGHKAGDDILRRVADVLNRFGSPERPTGRLGGDEFMVLLPGTSFRQAGAVAEGPVRPLAGRLQTVFDLRRQLFRMVLPTDLPYENERVAAPDLIISLPTRSLLVFDRGYLSFPLFDALTDGGAGSLPGSRRPRRSPLPLCSPAPARWRICWCSWASTAPPAASKHLYRLVTIVRAFGTRRYLTRAVLMMVARPGRGGGSHSEHNSPGCRRW